MSVDIVHFGGSECPTCRKRYFDLDRAESCEITHIVDRCREGFRSDVREIMAAKSGKEPAI